MMNPNCAGSRCLGLPSSSFLPPVVDSTVLVGLLPAVPQLRPSISATNVKLARRLPASTFQCIQPKVMGSICVYSLHPQLRQRKRPSWRHHTSSTI